jgi:hypothetical protein
MDWFLDKAQKILFAMEYGKEYRQAATELYRETVEHVLQQIAEDALVKHEGIGTHHKRLVWLRPELQTVYDRLEKEAVTNFVTAAKANETKD